MVLNDPDAATYLHRTSIPHDVRVCCTVGGQFVTYPRSRPPRPTSVSTDFWVTRIRDNGTVVVRQTRFQVSRTTAHFVEAEAALLLFDDRGTLIIVQHWPKPRAAYLGSD